MKVIVDCHGNDRGAAVAVQGAIKAMAKERDLSIAFCGKQEEISSCLSGLKYDESRVELIDAQDIISNEEHPEKIY